MFLINPNFHATVNLHVFSFENFQLLFSVFVIFSWVLMFWEVSLAISNVFFCLNEWPWSTRQVNHWWLKNTCSVTSFTLLYICTFKRLNVETFNRLGNLILFLEYLMNCKLLKITLRTESYEKLHYGAKKHRTSNEFLKSTFDRKYYITLSWNQFSSDNSFRFWLLKYQLDGLHSFHTSFLRHRSQLSDTFASNFSKKLASKLLINVPCGFK